MKTLNQFLNERLGGKGYKSYTSLTGKKVSGDWEDSDRGGGHKSIKRAGGKVEKKSPTYRAHVLNKEEVLDERQKTNQGERQSQEAGRSDYGKISVRNTRKFGKPGEPAVFDLPFSGGHSERGKMITQRRKEGKEKRGVKKVKGMKEDKAFNFVLDKIKKEVGKDGYVSKDNPRKKQTDAEKAKVRAHQAKLAKQDGRDETEKASDMRYNDRSRSD